MTIDLRLLPWAIAAWVGCAIGLQFALDVKLLVATVVMIALGLTFENVRVLAVVALLAALLAAFRVDAANPEVVAALVRNSGALEVTAVVNEQPQRRTRQGFGGLATEEQWSARITIISVASAAEQLATSIPATLRWPVGGPVPAVGSTIAVSTLLQPDNPARRSVYRLTARSAPVVVSAPSRGSDLFARIRGSLADVTGAGSASARAGATLLPGLVLGDTSAQSEQLVDDLRVSGLSHLTAVSGANVAIVLGAVLWMLQRTRVRRRHRYLLLLAVLVLFVAVVQPQPSVMRAAVMGAISVYAMATGALKQSASALWLSVIVLLVVDPFMAWQYGFGLSVAATAGLIVLQPWMAEHLPRHPLMQVLLVTLAAQIATLPLLLLMGQPPTWLSIPANIAAAPLVAPATVSGFVATLLASLALLPVPGLHHVLHALAVMVAFPGVLLSDLVVAIARIGAGSAFAQSPFESVGSSLLFIGVVTGAWVFRRRRRIAAVVVVAYAIVTFSPSLVPGAWPPDDWWYVMCDVGQGDASVIRLSDHSAVVVDAGPDPRALRRCLHRIGIRRIDVLILTHFHADHVEGVMALDDVDKILVSPLKEPAIEYERVRSHFQSEFTDIQRGDRIRVGSVAFDVLWPDPRNLTGDPNTDSVLMLLHTPNGTVLLGADTDVAAQQQFRPPQATVLKVPHHGSRYQDPRFLQAVGAAVSLVSVGRGNDYGHPARDTLQILTTAGSQVLRTDERGAIALVTRDGRLSVVSERR